MPRRFLDLGLGNVDEFGEWLCKSAITIDVAIQGVDKKHLIEKVQLRAKECENHRKRRCAKHEFLIFWKGN